MDHQIEVGLGDALVAVQDVFGSTSLDSVGITSNPLEQPSSDSLLLFDGPGSSQGDRWREEISRCLVQASMVSEAQKWDHCGKKGLVLKCVNNPDHRYYTPFHCDLRICPPCGKRYAQRIRARYRKPLEDLRGRGRRGKKSLKLLTLTKNKIQSELTPEVIRAFHKDVGKLIRKLYDGGLSVLEVGKGFNIHAHCLVYGPYVPQKELSEVWEKITGDSMVVDIRKVKGGKVPLRYILKYIGKPCRLKNPGDYVRYFKAIRGTRRVHSYGILYGIKGEQPSGGKARCPECNGELHYDRELSRQYNTATLRFCFGIKPYQLSVWRARMGVA